MSISRVLPAGTSSSLLLVASRLINLTGRSRSRWESRLLALFYFLGFGCGSIAASLVWKPEWSHRQPNDELERKLSLYLIQPNCFVLSCPIRPAVQMVNLFFIDRNGVLDNTAKSTIYSSVWLSWWYGKNLFLYILTRGRRSFWFGWLTGRS